MRFTPDSQRTPAQVATGACSFVVCEDGHPVIERRGNGQSFHMTYRARRGAEIGLRRARVELPSAYVEEVSG